MRQRCCPIFPKARRLIRKSCSARSRACSGRRTWTTPSALPTRSEEHTSELQSRLHLVCRLLLEKKKLLLQQRHPNFDRVISHSDYAAAGTYLLLGSLQ